jgi:ferredoxin, 2Fe-2S
VAANASEQRHSRALWWSWVGLPSPMEEDMLDFGCDVRANSRLSRQIKLIEAPEGLLMATPERQA